jgi:spore coat-associated protein N
VSRLSALAAHPRRTISALAVVLAAVGVTVGSGASFTASSANANNVFTAGTLTMGNTPSSAFLGAGNMKPGDNATGTVDIKNTGSVAGAFSLSGTVTSQTLGMASQLKLRVEDCGVFDGATPPSCGSGDVVHDGTVAGLSTVALGDFAGSVTHRYKFDVTLPGTTPNAFQGATATVRFDWNATTT